MLGGSTEDVVDSGAGVDVDVDVTMDVVVLDSVVVDSDVVVLVSVVVDSAVVVDDGGGVGELEEVLSELEPPFLPPFLSPLSLLLLSPPFFPFPLLSLPSPLSSPFLSPLRSPPFPLSFSFSLSPVFPPCPLSFSRKGALLSPLPRERDPWLFESSSRPFRLS